MARSVIGFHYGPGGNKRGIGDWMRVLNEAGIPFLVKGADDAGVCFEGQEIGKEFGVDNWLIYRLSTAGQGGHPEYDVPNYTKPPAEAAREHWENTVAKWPPELDSSIVWMEPINEPRAKASESDAQWNDLHPTDWLGKFMVEFAKIANADGYKVCGPAFNSGEPEVFATNDYELPGMLAYMRYCAEHPDQAALAIHEYVWRRYRDGETWENWYPHLFGRVEAAFAAADKHGISRDFHVFVTEWGFEHFGAPHWNEAEPHLTAYNEWAARWPQIKGVASWTLQSGWDGVDDDVVTWIRPLIDYAKNKEFDPGQQPAKTHDLFGGTLPGGRETSTGDTAPADAIGGSDAEAAGFKASVDLGTTNLVPHQRFQASWTFINSGESIWDETVELVYTDDPHPKTDNLPRAHFAEKVRYPITDLGAPVQVLPGDTVTLTLDMIAPGSGGFFGSNWQLYDAAGLPFGPIRWLRANVVPAQGNLGHHDVEFISFTNSVPAYENMPPNHNFTATWQLRNSGSDPWLGDFRLASVDVPHPETAGRLQDLLGGPTSYTLKELSGADRVGPGEVVTVVFSLRSPAAAGSYAYHWQLQTADGRPFGGLRWMKLGVVEPAAVVSTTAGTDDGEVDPGEGPVKRVEFGMNVNINDGHAIDAERLAGLGWVRYVYWATRRKKSPQQAFNDHYRNIIEAYASRGIRSLLILHQDTFWGNAPWNNGGWGEYATGFAQACADVAQAVAPFKGMVAYQIYNEVDSGFGNDAGNVNHSAIGISPQNYAALLEPAVRAIRAVDPDAKIIISGMKTGPGNAINYIKEVRSALDGRLLVDALAYHPYGRFVTFDPFYNQAFGTMKDAFDLFRNAFPELPLWITEIGVADNNPIGPEHYEKIARYMREVIDDAADNHNDLIEVLIWFGWSDLMRNAGITTLSGELKAHVGDAYRAMVERGRRL